MQINIRVYVGFPDPTLTLVIERGRAESGKRRRARILCNWIFHAKLVFLWLACLLLHEAQNSMDICKNRSSRRADSGEI